MSNMQSIFRSTYTQDFTVLGNQTLEDSRLTFEARGLLCFLLAKPLDWTVIMQHLINSSPAGKHVVTRIVGELLEYGYLVRSRLRDSNGCFKATLYQVHAKPQSGYREVVKPKVEDPEADKQRLQKKQVTKNTNYKETPTTNKHFSIDEFSWPKGVLLEQKKSILKISEKEDVVVVQKILDVISESKKEVKNFVGLYRHLLILNKGGELDFSNSILSQRKREKIELAEKRHKEQIRLSEARILKYVDGEDPANEKYE